MSVASIPALHLPPDADAIYGPIADLPIVSPHGHCDAGWFADDAPFPDPARLLLVPDHYVFRLLYSQGVPLEALGVARAGELPDASFEPRAAFHLFAQHWQRFVGTPSHLWLSHTLRYVFGIDERLEPDNSDRIYDTIDAALASEAFRPRALFERFGIEVLATTDDPLDKLDAHARIRDGDWSGRVIPTFRPDALLDATRADFGDRLTRLAELTGLDTHSYGGFLDALRARRRDFIALGATASDHGVLTPHTIWLDRNRCETLFARAVAGTIDAHDAADLRGHLLIEMAQMSLDDGLVMQLHAGSRRATNRAVTERFGPDTGSDIPQRVNWVAGLDALLNRIGNNANLTLIAFTLDEGGYARELAPMAGHWPALRLGPPWWFHDSANGIARYLDNVVETAGYWNLAGFNDDTRAFLSIPARHDLWRRAVSLHLATQQRRGLLGTDDVTLLARMLSVDLARDTYRLRGADA